MSSRYLQRSNPKPEDFPHKILNKIALLTISADRVQLKSLFAKNAAKVKNLPTLEDIL